MNTFEALKKEIETRLQGAREPFAVFDFDNTCIKGDIGEALWEHLIRTGRLDKTLNERYDALLAQGRVKEAYLLYGTILEGLTEAEAAKAVQVTLRETEGVLSARPIVLALMDFLKEKKVAVWVVSASHEIAVRAAMQKFGIEAHLIGIQNVIKDGRYTAELKQPVSMLEGKVECLRAYIHPTQAPLLVIDDNPSGIPLLEAAGIKVVVDYHQAFVDEARKRGWFIL